MIKKTSQNYPETASIDFLLAEVALSNFPFLKVPLARSWWSDEIIGVGVDSELGWVV